MEFLIFFYISILACVGSFIQRVCGFGFGIFIMTILPFLSPSYPEATALSGLLSCCQSAFVLIKMYKYINWKHLILILITFSIFSFFAVQYVAQAAETNLKFLLGIVLILMSLYFLIFSKKIKIKPTKTIQLSLGAVSGTMGGLFGMHGPPAVIYFIEAENDKNCYIAICQAYFVITNIIMTCFRAKNGFLTSFVGIGIVFSIVGIVIGSLLGQKVFDKISPEKLKKIVYFYLIFAGIMAMI
ncbi:MAG: sulfite exporter TauE/SafE family protein [Bacteroidales bacterium]|nr:sulfite exporter TauE/SafE family protein [Bacteroidales bacterium]